MIQNNKDELERFKVEINLSEYFASKGYALDSKASCGAYAVMRKDDEKMVITKAPDGHHVFTDAHDPSNCGSIIDATQHITGKNLGQVRKELRPWIGESSRRPRPKLTAYQPEIRKTDPEFGKVIASWDKASSVYDYSYLKKRGLKRTTIDRYSSVIAQSSKGTLMFRHLTDLPISGYEYKAKNYAGFSTGGRKGLFVARLSDADKVRKIVVTETALDALSYAQLDGCRKDTAYVSTGGNPSLEQIEQLKGLVDRYKFGVVLAHDNDRGGELQANLLQEKIGGERHRPDEKDWTKKIEVLKEQHQDMGMSR